ncbi:MAG: hypothetical protein K9K32_00175 [Halanaerobiales bacterium]|nr:hypothetical protein [Halanaerobiales bacterium]
MDISELLKNSKIPYKEKNLNKKYLKKSKISQSSLILADSSIYRSIGKEIASRIVYNYLKENKPRYNPVYLYKPVFTVYLNENRKIKNLWRKTDALIFDGVDEYSNRWDFQNITNLITSRIYNDKLTIMIATSDIENRIKEYNGDSFLSLLTSLPKIEVQ